MTRKIQLYWFFPLFVAMLVAAAVVIIDLQINYFRASYFSALEQEIGLRNRLMVAVCKDMFETDSPPERLENFFKRQAQNPFVLRIKKRSGGPVVFQTARTPERLNRLIEAPEVRKIMRGPAQNEVLFKYNHYFDTWFAYNAIKFNSKSEQYVLLMVEQCDSITRLVKLSEFAIVTLSALGLCIIAGLVVYFLRQIHSPLERLEVSTRAIASGDFNYPVYVPSSGVVRKIAISVHDMAEHLRGQIIQLKTLEDRRRDFLAAVSHAMKTPLTGILSAVDGIRQGALDDPEFRQECLKAIENQSLRLSGLLHEFISLSAIERQEIKKDKDFLPVRIIELANEASLSFRQGAVRTEFVFEETTPEELPGEPSLLIQALENLFSNAVSHGKATLIRVAVRRENNSLIIDVCDNGSGIPEEHRARIFERFYRGTAKRPENVPGNGLGLVIVKRIVSLHNGDIELAPQYGMWQTVFRITLPSAGK